jgi:hypothetical protein
MTKQVARKLMVENAGVVTDAQTWGLASAPG